MKFKIIILSTIFILLITSFPLHSLPSSIHNQQIGNSLFGVSSWPMMQNNPESVLTRYYVATNAASIAIDGKLNTYSDLVNNISKLNPVIADNLPPFKDLSPLSGGGHRYYNHQGFYVDYSDNNRAGIWELNREKVLRPSMATIYGVDANSWVSDVSMIQSYYTHILGDLQEGTIRSINQMVGVSSDGRTPYDLRTPSGVIAAYNSDVSRSFPKMTQEERTVFRKYQVELDTLKKVYVDFNYDDDLLKLRDISRETQQKFDEILKRRDTELGNTIKAQIRNNKLKAIYKSSAIGGVQGAALGLTISILSEGFSKGFTNISWHNVVTTTGIMAVAGAFYPLAEIGTIALAKGAFHASPFIALKAAGSVAVGLDLLLDIGFSYYYWKTGLISGNRALRQGSIRTISNLATTGLIYGAVAITNKLTLVGATTAIVSGAKAGGTLGTLGGPVGTAVGLSFGVALALGSYLVLNPMIDNLLFKWDASDILNKINADPGMVKAWTAEYMEQPV